MILPKVAYSMYAKWQGKGIQINEKRYPYSSPLYSPRTTTQAFNKLKENWKKKCLTNDLDITKMVIHQQKLGTK